MEPTSLVLSLCARVSHSLWRMDLTRGSNAVRRILLALTMILPLTTSCDRTESSSGAAASVTPSRSESAATTPAIAQTSVSIATTEQAPAMQTSTIASTRPVAVVEVDLTKLALSGLEAASAKTTIVPAADMPFAHAVQISTVVQPKMPWDIQFKISTMTAIKAGDALLATFYMRTIDTKSESGEARVGLTMQQASPPWRSTLEQEMSAPPTWMKVTLPFAAQVSWPAGRAQATLNFGFEAQTIELADFSIVDYGPGVRLRDLPQPQFSYAGREPDAPWRIEAAERIKKFREGDLSVKVVDAQGQPVPDAIVQIQMTRHAFGFGSAITVSDLMGIKPDDQRYRDAVQRCFNRVVFENDMKWRAWDDVLRQKKTIKAVKWLRNHDIDVRGHCMVWPGWPNLPDNLKSLSNNPPALAARVDAHITDIGTAFAPFHLCAWDVVNETKTNHDLQDLLGHAVLAHWFGVAHEAAPGVPLFLNENSVLESGTKADFFFSELKYLQDQAAPLGGIGLQGHFAWNPTPPVVVLQRLDRFAAFNVPIDVTEFDMNVSDEKLQADYTRDLMTAVFSHPSADGIIMWGFWDTKHWLPNSPL